MAKILLCFSAHLFHNGSFRIVCFYDGLIKSFIEEGNEVMVVNGAEFLHQSWNGDNNNLPPYINASKLIQDVKAFAPELVIAFNHCIPQKIEEICECPIVLWDADSIPFWNAKKYVRLNLSKYIFFGFSYESIDSALAFGAKKEQIHLVRPATAIQAQKMDYKQNICFIGSNFQAPESFIKKLNNENIQDLRQRADYLVDDFYKIQELDSWQKKPNLDDLIFASLISTQNRVTVLNNLHDLGLVIWGDNWLDIGRYLPWLSFCYNKDVVYSLQHNQDIYNSSKLCISISHAQAKKGFPWRVMDIMASNGCLISDFKEGIRDFTKNFVDIPMYHSIFEARDLCQKILKDEKWREEICLQSQHCINEKGRWQHRFKEMEQILNIKLLACKPREKSLLASHESIEPVPVQAQIQPSSADLSLLNRNDYISSHNNMFLSWIKFLCKFFPMKYFKYPYLILNKLTGFNVDSLFIAEVRTENRKGMNNSISLSSLYKKTLLDSQIAIKLCNEYPNKQDSLLELEKSLLECSQHIFSNTENNLSCKDTIIPNQKIRILHIFTRCYTTGGHTQVCQRWINLFHNEEIHSVVLLSQGNRVVPKQFIEEISRSGGELFDLSASGCPIEKALRLRKIGSEFSYVVLHTHPQDIIPVLAFGVNEFKTPVILYNHADHLAWLGLSITDLVVNFRDMGRKINEEKRGIKRNITVHLPSGGLNPNVMNSTNKSFLLRKQLNISQKTKVIITAASEYKFVPFNGNDMAPILLNIVNQMEDIVILVIGVRKNNKRWKKIHQQSDGKIRPIGMIHSEDFIDYVRLADLAIESYPMGSTMTMLDIVNQNIPFYSIKTPINYYEPFDEWKVYCESPEDLIQKVNSFFSPENKNVTIEPKYIDVKAQLKKIFAQLPKEHKIYSLPETTSNELSERDSYYLASIKSQKKNYFRHKILPFIQFHLRLLIYISPKVLLKKLYKQLNPYGLM